MGGIRPTGADPPDLSSSALIAQANRRDSPAPVAVSARVRRSTGNGLVDDLVYYDIVLL